MDTSKVIWSEGMFLCAQHFQQHDRFIEHLINSRCRGIQPFSWGFHKLSIDSDLLKIGKLALKKCSGIFPDGTSFNLPEDDELPVPLDVPNAISNELVYLSLPVRRPEVADADSEDAPESLSRYRMREKDVSNNNTIGEGKIPLHVGKLKTRLLTERNERSGYTCLGIARIVEARGDKNIIIDEKFIPPNLNCIAMTTLLGYMRELVGLLNIRGEAIASRLGSVNHGGDAGMKDFYFLQMINRYQPLLQHLSDVVDLHPEEFFRLVIQMAGELATFFKSGKRPSAFPAYCHDDLQSAFGPVMDELRNLLGRIYEQRAIPIPLTELKGNSYGARRLDTSLMNSAGFVLAAKAQVSSETLRHDFPRQVIIGPYEIIENYITSLTPGITIHPLPVAPRQLPYHAGFTYFELNKQCDLWEKMMTSAGFVIHISGSLPGLQLEFWAIKEG